MQLKSFQWIYFILKRFNAADTRGRSAITGIFSIAGISLGVTALIVILSVMNGFQMGFIDAILQVSSAHLRLSGAKTDIEHAEKFGGYVSFYRFSEAQTLMEGNCSRQQGALLRAVPTDLRAKDSGFNEIVKIMSGTFDLEKKNTVVLGYELARQLSIKTGDIITVLAVSGSSDTNIFPENNQLLVTGTFKTGYYEIDASFAFVSLETGTIICGESETYNAAVKLENPEHDSKYLHSLQKTIPSLHAESWRTYNRAFFGALRIEKNMMMLLVILIFLVVTVNIYNGMRRSIYERREEIAVLASLGARIQDIRFLFMCNGFTIGLIGGIIGLLLGLLLSAQINEVFFLIEVSINIIIHFIGSLVSNITEMPFAIFSPEYFYNVETIPVRIFFKETVFIFLFGVFSASSAAWFAARKILTLKPAEVLRYE
ncbi:FtsX-like permease family protein [Treponema phagedenis]|uniref:FtsX-like permease family protein n=1 Tax=Treponema phagedenis TaxID=162 RepID=UPI0001F64059|nr:FtsX-like permease family protein [Treponema phagedenis]EFW39395.1 efflux ABC transporter, permease protein [Treponema phagedenis F0421]TYT76688.1 ABC transporter permease [Treponema phagedenis]